jgi:hypothetical protein
LRKRIKKKSSETNLVRPSRDGDQFHYLWAARRCLNLLPPGSDLKAVTIEGASPSEKAAGRPIKAGEAVIDVAEYFGSSDFQQATLVRYVQLKHSTEAPNKPWPPSGLENTIDGFVKRYKAILAESVTNGKRHPALEFLFVSNRPISPAIAAAVENAAKGLAVKASDLKKLEQYTGLNGAKLSAFCKLLKLEGRHDALWDQRNILFQDVSQYLPDSDVDAPTQLKELVTRKALSEAASNPTIERMDVLRALKTDEDRLYPAPCRIEQLHDAVPREQEGDLFKAIVNARNTPVIVHAEGGVGKSIFATRIKLGLPPGSATVLYDCFGNAQYRSATGYRHRHKDALVQIVNELAGKSLCHLLIPTSNAGASDYLKKFIYRLEQAVSLLRAQNPQALLCIIVDAADNAQMAAEESGDARAFVLDLLREHIPDGVRLVALCRSHRQPLLDPPPSALKLELKPFSRAETAAHLVHTFPSASQQDIDEFHRLSSQNPRVQALALSAGGSLQDILRRLGPNPTTVEKAIGNLLSAAIAKMRDASGAIEKTQIDRLCAGLAVLRPLVPISVLSSMSGVPASAIKSFAFDLGRPLIVTGETIQFFDEPSETWFREEFKPSAADLGSFVASIKPLASGSAYVAAALPQLMLEAGQFDDLVTLALSSEALPELNPLDRRDVELQRLQFALKARLRAKRYLDAAKLALKAGGETAGDERQRGLLQDNTDLAAVFMESDRIQELVSRRVFGSGWVGSHNAYEAALMSGRAELQGDARSRLRMAVEWLSNWGRLPNDERREEKITETDIGEMAAAIFNIHGARACANDLKRWTPPTLAFTVGRHLARRFVDHSRYNDLDDLANAAGDNPFLVLAIVVELREVHRVLSKPVVSLCLKHLQKPRFKFEIGDDWSERDSALNAVTALVEASHRLSAGSATALAKLLTRYLPKKPPRGLSSQFSSSRTLFLRAYALRAALRGKTLELLDLAHPELRTELEKKKSHSQTRDAQEFREDIGALLPWYKLWAARFVKRSRKAGLPAAIAEAVKESGTAARINHREEWRTSDEIAEIWLAILVQANATDEKTLQELNDWMANLKRPLFTPTLARLARRTSRLEALSTHSLQYATKAFQLTHDERQDADSKSGMYISLARSVLAASRSEAQAYFNQAIEVASKVGDENIDRWAALLDLAEAASDPVQPVPELAYRLSRCAEVTYDYVARDKHFDWSRTVEAIAGLCPSSTFAILSRWRDRDFGWAERVLPMAVDALIERRVIDARKALPLIGFRAQWDLALLVKSGLEACGAQAEKQSLADYIYRYIEMEEHSLGVWRDLKDTFAKHNIVVTSLQARLDLQENKQKALHAEEDDGVPRSSRRARVGRTRDWNAIFQGLDLTAANDLSVAQQRFRKTKPPFYQDQFFKEAFSRVTAGKEAEFVAALTDVPEFDLYHFRGFLESVPAEWKARLAVKSALAAVLRTFCRRYCMEITRGRYYEVLPLKTACALAEVPESDIIDVVLSGIGEVTEIVGVGRLFTLVGLLSGKLTRSESLDALGYGLQLLDVVLKEADGDGPWSPNLAPPAEIDAAIAGYIFGGLASPTATIRWEAAHAVHAVCHFQDRDILRALVLLGDGATGGVFADARLHFYHLHARQWLLIALARAANDYPQLVAGHSDFILKYVQPTEMHVLIREFTKRAALALFDAGLLASELREQISNVNVSPFPAIESRSYNHPVARSATTTPVEERFHFGFDIGPYWFAPLARCFGLGEDYVGARAAAVIAQDWHYPGRLHWEEDERTRRKILKHEDTHYSHSSYPRADELRFYLSYHAMMVVAGQMLATMPTYSNPDYSEDDFSGWLHSRHDLSRRDGYWLADRRDPIALNTHSWKQEKEGADWRSSVRRSDLDRVLSPSDGMLTLWGNWTAVSGRCEQVCNIRSALVSSGRSQALLRALQSADNPHDFIIPNADDDDSQIDFGRFRLKGWIVDQSRDSGIDYKDPWAGKIGHPAPSPSPEVSAAMNLNADRERRNWRQAKSAEPVLTAETWGTFRDKDEEGSNERGDRIQTTLAFTTELLRTFDMDMIVSVEIERRRGYRRYESGSDDEKKPIPPSARIFLIKADGRIRTI